MKNIALLFSIIILASGICLAQTSGFTYQGKLADAGSPANGTYQFECKLFDADTAGNQIGSSQTVIAAVQNGIFTTRLDFGAAAFVAGQDRWLEISVRLNGSGDAYAVLSPRQQVNSVPFAVRSLKATDADNATNLGGVSSSSFVQTTDARLSDPRPPAPGSANYIRNSVDQQFGNFNISGNGTVGGTFTAVSLNGDGSGLTNIRATFLWQLVAGSTERAQSNTGYVVTGSRQAIITLPSAPNVSDLVRVSSAGAGGWRIAQNGGQSIFLANLGLVGAEWTARESNRRWQSVASSADGSKLVAVVEGGQIYTSTNSGVSWTPRESNRLWQSVASSADGTKLVAVVGGGGRFGGQIYTSADSGVIWTPHENNRLWTSVASSVDGRKLVAVVGGGLIYTSTNSGVSWIPREGNRAWISVASSADGTKLVAVVGGSRPGGQIYTSVDSGASWTPRGNNRIWTSVASSADGSKLVAVATSGGLNPVNRQIYTSADSGVSWTPHESNRNWISVASSADGSRLIAVVSGGQIYTSTDSGVTWAPHEGDRPWSAVASSADGSKLVAVVSAGQIYTSSGSSFTTTTLGTAGDLVGGQMTAVELQYVGSGLWIPLSHEGLIVGH
jgi:hypothetical protein